MKNALLRLREACSSLSAAEQQIARFIMKTPKKPSHPAHRPPAGPAHFYLAFQRGAGLPSVGFDGYMELRRALVGELAALGDKGRHPEAELSPNRRCAGDRRQGHPQKHSVFVRLAAAALPRDRRGMRPSAGPSRCVLLFGLGSSLLVAHDAYLKFLRLDKPCMVTDDWHAQLLSARNATLTIWGSFFPIPVRRWR